MLWGVTLNTDPRMTPALFGDFKSADRRATDAKLLTYIREPSKLRQTGQDSCGIAVVLAAPGAGKTRLLDDVLRMELDTTHFLRLAITFTGTTSYVGAHPLAVRALREFFCEPAREAATDVLRAIDGQLSRLFPRDNSDTVARLVLDALEAVYFQRRGGVVGRTVLLVDEIAQAKKKVATDHEPCEQDVYDTVVAWIDAGGSPSRRGAVITSLNLIKAMTPLTVAGRPLTWLPLGVFDVEDENVRHYVMLEARKFWPSLAQLPESIWQLLASTGGRPRDIFNTLESLWNARVVLERASTRELLSALFVLEPDPRFRRYVLPSMLGLAFSTSLEDTHGVLRFTVFGRNVTSAALLNADLVGKPSASAIPAVALGHAKSLLDADAQLCTNFVALMEAAAFGERFEDAWMLLTHNLLRLQFLVRVPNTGLATSGKPSNGEDFWPLTERGVKLGGPKRPTARQINVFATKDSAASRIEALFAMPTRALQAPGSSINRKIDLATAPALALWKSLWVDNVDLGSAGSSQKMWDVVSSVEWRSSTLVCFSDSSHAAADFLLLVGEANGTGADEPHVYVFRAPPGGGEDGCVAAVASLQKQLERLFAPERAATHVLRRAGLHSARQVTLCIAAINVGDVDLAALGAPFNVVLFGAADLSALGGAPFRNTRFFRQLAAVEN